MATEPCYEVLGGHYHICIMPIKTFLHQLPERIDSAAVLFSSYPKPNVLTKDDLFLNVDDVTNPSRPTAFTKEDASTVVSFLKKTNASRFYICCDGGVSRSAALAAALLFVSNGSDGEIWGDAKFHPNPLIYSIMRSTLGCPCEDEELSRKVLENETALARKIHQMRKG